MYFMTCLEVHTRRGGRSVPEDEMQRSETSVSLFFHVDLPEVKVGVNIVDMLAKVKVQVHAQGRLG